MESVAGIKWNGWPEWTGITGRDRLEYSPRNFRPPSCLSIYARVASVLELISFDAEALSMHLAYLRYIFAKLPMASSLEDYEALLPVAARNVSPRQTIGHDFVSVVD